MSGSFASSISGALSAVALSLGSGSPTPLPVSVEVGKSDLQGQSELGWLVGVPISEQAKTYIWMDTRLTLEERGEGCVLKLKMSHAKQDGLPAAATLPGVRVAGEQAETLDQGPCAQQQEKALYLMSRLAGRVRESVVGAARSGLSVVDAGELVALPTRGQRAAVAKAREPKPDLQAVPANFQKVQPERTIASADPQPAATLVKAPPPVPAASKPVPAKKPSLAVEPQVRKPALPVCRKGDESMVVAVTPGSKIYESDGVRIDYKDFSFATVPQRVMCEPMNGRWYRVLAKDGSAVGWIEAASLKLQ